MAAFAPTGVSASVSVPASHEAIEDVGPVALAVLSAMFAQDKNGVWRFRHGESDRHECKEAFGFKYSDKWLRAVAALANNQGGYLIFGVRDKAVTAAGTVSDDSYKVVGLSNPEFENADPVDFTKRLKATFDPTPVVEAACIEIGGVTIGILHVRQHASRPIISVKNEGNSVREGEIYFRYFGQSARLKYSDLRSILDERDRQAREQILPMVEKLLTIGPRDAMVADLDTRIYPSPVPFQRAIGAH